MEIRKVLIFLFSILASTTAAASCLGGWWGSSKPQMYIGIQGGYVDTNFNKSTVIEQPSLGGAQITSANIDNHVFGARGYAGYQFNEYLALEGGYFKPRNTRYTNINNGTVPNGDVSEYAVDLSGKVFLPMAAYIHLSPYFKLGIAYLNATSHGGITRNGANDFGYSWHPVLGAGIGYDIFDNITMDLSWTTITRRNSSVPRIDMLFLGFTYHFSFEDVKSGGPNYGDVNGTDP